MELWLVLLWYQDDQAPIDIIGIFDSQEAADLACRTAMHTMGRMTLNEDLGDKRTIRDGWLCPRQGLENIGGKWASR